jgi:predicted RNA polymerase sigma factor
MSRSIGAMAQRISRAKATIKASGVPFQLPAIPEREQPLRAVLHVLYLIFNEGYTSTAGANVQRPELAREAIRLTRSLHTVLPEDAEVAGLLALMLLTDARRAARTGPEGELIPLAKQDRALWDQTEISEGTALLTAALSKASVGAYQLQAAIAAAMVHGPSKGLELFRELDSDARLAGHHRLDAVRAHLLEMAGDHEGAITHYRIAAGRTMSIPERNYLITQAARLSESTVRPEPARPDTDGSAS